MSAALSPVAPEVLKKILVAYAYDITEESEHNWVLFRGKKEPPLIIPKHGDSVGVAVMSNALHQAKMNNETFFRLLEEVQESITS